MLDSNSICKVPPNGIIPVKEFNYEELDCFLELLYTGSLPEEKVEKHVRFLSLADDKYGIPYLRKFCERHMLGCLNSSNAIDALETSVICSYESLKKTVVDFIVNNAYDIVSSDRYAQFAHERPDLNVEITRAIVMQGKTEK
ncbi:BTB/POZ domain-containing protein At3g56230-like [Corylus avellana]|uniref:BTB/POZ domain-containing protein At3g56230-like n=1 Tax=Corylus avellana TaxID=13451 RepID=UPI00286A1607|nr:BTB/POZ domain-containing protein At3g56230-like [Corylus avellana]